MKCTAPLVSRLAATIACIATLWMSSSLCAGARSHPPFVIHGARIFDGAQVHSGSVVVVDGVIAAMGHEIAIPTNARVVDGTGRTLLPGLIDAHTHVVDPQMLVDALLFGVTTELDMFSPHDVGAILKAEQSDGGALDRADLFSAGTLATAPNGHGAQYGLQIPTIDDPTQAQSFVDDRIAEGSDYIKIVYDHGELYGSAKPIMSAATFQGLVEAARLRDKLTVVHIDSLHQARRAIAAGADGLAHLFLDHIPGPDFSRRLAKHDAFVIPTLTALESLTGLPSGASLIADVHLAPFISEDAAWALRSAYPRPFDSVLTIDAAYQTVRQLRDAGVPILVGTDAPSPGTAHGVSIHRELELLVDAGLTPTEALAGATSAPAEHFRLSDRGRLAPGMRADLLLVEGDPTADITATRNIVAVWKQGVEADRESFRKSTDD